MNETVLARDPRRCRVVTLNQPESANALGMAMGPRLLAVALPRRK